MFSLVCAPPRHITSHSLSQTCGKDNLPASICGCPCWCCPAGARHHPGQVDADWGPFQEELHGLSIKFKRMLSRALHAALCSLQAGVQ